MTKVITKNIAKVIMKNMKKTFSKTSIRAIAFSFLFLISGIGAAVLVAPVSAAPNAAAAPVAAASPLSQAEANWAYPNGNQANQDYNPQNQINSSNAQYMGITWLFPLPTLPPALTTYAGAGGLGVDAAPLIVNGTIYAVTNFDQVFALNALNGDVLWTDTIPLSLNSSVGTNTGALTLHAHDGTDQFTTATLGPAVSGPTLWFQAADQKVYAIDALTGRYELNFTTFSGLNMVSGNSPSSTYHGVGAANILIDQARGVLISSHGAELSADNGRCFYRGWNIKVNPPTPMWTTYCTPPQPGGNIPLDPNWTINQVNSMSSAEIFYPGVTSTNGYTTPAEVAGGVQFNTNNNLVVQLKSLSQSQLNASLYNDWGYAGQTAQCQAITGGASTGSTGAGWGGAWLLGSGPTSGMAFVNTNNKDPWVGPCNPGPDLWSASLLAVNVTTGAWIWGFQANAHDIWDYDCSWWQGMGNETINGVSTQVLWKTCKNGYLYEINAKTGNLIWSWNPPSNMIPRCSVCYMLNPLNRTQMTLAFPTANLQPYLQYPSASAGFEDEQAYSPTLNYIFAAAQNVPSYIGYVGLNSSSYFGAGGITATGETLTPVNHAGSCSGCGPASNNNTLFAIDAATGQVKWSYFVPLQGYRGGVTTSGNIVFLTLSSGDMLTIDAQTGKLIRDYFIGGPLNVLPSIGATTSGNVVVLIPILAGLVTWGTSVPGDLVAMSLQSVPSTSTNTVTSTSTTTVTTPGVGSTSTSTTTVTLPGTSSVSTTTITASSSGGVSTTTAYGIAAVAVIFIIATGYLAMRGRKPAS
jgi:glucose dehydrogenase